MCTIGSRYAIVWPRSPAIPSVRGPLAAAARGRWPDLHTGRSSPRRTVAAPARFAGERTGAVAHRADRSPRASWHSGWFAAGASVRRLPSSLRSSVQTTPRPPLLALRLVRCGRFGAPSDHSGPRASQGGPEQSSLVATLLSPDDAAPSAPQLAVTLSVPSAFNPAWRAAGAVPVP